MESNYDSHLARGYFAAMFYVTESILNALITRWAPWFRHTGSGEIYGVSDLTPVSLPPSLISVWMQTNAHLS